MEINLVGLFTPCVYSPGCSAPRSCRGSPRPRWGPPAAACGGRRCLARCTRARTGSARAPRRRMAAPIRGQYCGRVTNERRVSPAGWPRWWSCSRPRTPPTPPAGSRPPARPPPAPGNNTFRIVLVDDYISWYTLSSLYLYLNINPCNVWLSMDDACSARFIL